MINCASLYTMFELSLGCADWELMLGVMLLTSATMIAAHIMVVSVYSQKWS